MQHNECRLPKYFVCLKAFGSLNSGLMTELRAILKKAGIKQSAVARAAGRSAGTVSQWVSGNRQVPADLVPAIEAETGISRSDIRPDLWPTEAA